MMLAWSINIPVMSDLNEKPLDQEKLKAGFAFHETLNEKIWDQYDMDQKVRLTLLRAAKAFYDFLDIDGLRIEDIIMTGSNAAYNYTEFSDIDVHLIVDFASTPFPTMAENLFVTKKNLWNRTHDITVRGYGLEMYVEDVSNPVTAMGVYSLLRGEWIKRPEQGEIPKWDDGAVASKIENFADQIDELVQNHDLDAIHDLSRRLKAMRQSGLAKYGEFSTENLAFKGLRNLGYLELLYAARRDAEDAKLSLENAE